LGDLRVFYEVKESDRVVIVTAIGGKRHNELWVGDEKIEL